MEEASIDSVHTALERGEITCSQLIETYLRRIEKDDKRKNGINSIIMVNPNALDIADELDKRFQKEGLTGSLHGIPVLLKDNINTKDMATTAGSISLEGVIPKEDAFIVKRLKKAGAIILAKVNLHEFAIWGETISSILGQTLNPYDLTRTPGGSSGGTGAGIAANFGIIGIGTDTINSIRSPASACNLVGFRPTIGLVSRNGIIPYSLTQDTAGPIMRTVGDTAKVMDVIAGYDSKDSTTAWSVGHIPRSYTEFLNTRGMEGKRIGILRSFFGKEKEHQEVNSIIYRSLEHMENQGSILIDIHEDLDADRMVEQISVHLHDFKAHLNEYLRELGDKIEIKTLSDIIASGKYHRGIEDNIKLALGLDINTSEYRERIIKRLQLKNLIMEIMAQYDLDVIAYPHQKRPVVKIGEAQIDRNGVLASVTGFPACVVPAGFTRVTDMAPLGIPIGLEFLAREWNEALLFEIAYGFESSTGFRKSPE